MNDANSTSTDSSRFVDNGDTIIDTRRKLIWSKEDSWQMSKTWMSWTQTRDYAVQLNKKLFGGFKNWRMPTSEEAKSLFQKTYSNKDHMGQNASIPPVFPPGFGFLCWTSDVRNKIQAIRFSYRKGSTMYDDIYRVSRGATRFVRDIENEV